MLYSYLYMSKKTVILSNFKIYFLRLWSYDWGLQYSTRLLPQSLNISSYGAIEESNIESFYLKEKRQRVSDYSLLPLHKTKYKLILFVYGSW